MKKFCCTALAMFALAGCSFRIEGLEGEPQTDGDVEMPPDGAVAPSDGAVTPPDGAVTPPDLGDGEHEHEDANGPELSDLGVVFQPSHVGPGYFVPGASSLMGVTKIDTSNLQLAFNGGSLAAPPAGVSFVRDAPSGYAVLSVGVWTVDQPIEVEGSAPLVVVASGSVFVAAAIDGSAHGRAPGPGGQVGGPGGGGNGTNNGADDSGGGGGGFGSDGAPGGDSNGTPKGGPGGKAYGSDMNDFGGGSGGGIGGSQDKCGSGSVKGLGGGGGGAIQISSSVSITLSATGAIHVAGGGGSGGEIFLEAPSLVNEGTLTANGGGGGGAGVNVVFTDDGDDGEDGLRSTDVASGGAGGVVGLIKGAKGGSGGTGASAPKSGENGDENGGGGGGAVGRIWLRTHDTPPTGAGTMSPPPMVSTSL